MTNDEMAEKVPLNELLQYERERHNWSREYVAEHIGAPEVRMVGRWEREGVVPSPQYRHKLCELYGRNAKELGFVKLGEIPFWNVPYRRNPFFTGREALLADLRQVLVKDNTAAIVQPRAISGLGGVGKTQIALEYAYRFAPRYQSVLWVRAVSREILISDFGALALVLNLPQKDAQEQSIVFDAVKKWLSVLTRWLLILDNAEDLQMIHELLPQAARGHILLTTRSQASGQTAKPVEVESMEPDEGTLFLLRRARIIPQEASPDDTSYADRVNARGIAEAMGGLPLALDQAGAYIEETNCGLARYLDLYQTRGDVLLRERGNLFPEHPEAVAGTFLLSFEKVQQTSLAAADLLQLCAFLHPDAIPEEIIIEGASVLGPALDPLAADRLEFDKAIKELLKYSFIRRDPHDGTLTIHRLLQAVLKERVDESTQRLWAERVVRAVNRGFPEGDVVGAWPRCQRYLPNVYVCAALIRQWQISAPEAIRLLHQAGRYLRERGLFEEAQSLLEQALAICELNVELAHRDIIHILNDLALLYINQGKHDRAESLFKKILAILEQATDFDHRDSSMTFNNMAALYFEQGFYQRAEEFYLKALSIREENLGVDHSEVASTLNDLAWNYFYQGKYALSEQLYLRVLSIYQQRQYTTHPLYATALNNLAEVYRAQGNYIQAEQFHHQALSIMEQSLGQDHPELANSLNNLANLYETMGKIDQAESLHQEALRIRLKAFGTEHVHVISSYAGLAAVSRERGKYAQAEQFFLNAVEIARRVLGPDHLELAISLQNLGSLYRLRGMYMQAEAMLQESLAIRERTLGLDNIQVVFPLNVLAEVNRLQGKYDQAEVLLERAFAIYAKTIDPEHIYVAISLNYEGLIYLNQGRYAEGESLFQRALAIRERKLGTDHRDYAAVLNNLGRLYTVQGTYAEAESPLKQALAMRERLLGPDHSDVAQSLNDLALFYDAVQNHAEAERLLARALTISRQSWGPDHPEVAAILENYNRVLHKLGRGIESAEL